MNTPERHQQPDQRDPAPDAVPVHHAATVMLVADLPGPDGVEVLHVLLVHRTARVVFAPDSWVFPGGRVDPDDHAANFDSLCDGLTDAEASQIIDVASGGLAWWIAACRETLEESGILLASDLSADGSADEATVTELRRLVNNDESLFVDLLTARGIRLDMSSIEEVARFITPVGPPRRFDARFFVARAPQGQQASHDHGQDGNDGEIVNTAWVRPAEALEQWRAGKREMMSPTVRMVACLASYRSADEVMEAARLRLPYQRVRVVDPNGEYRVVLPGEPGYETAELEVESGWVRLYPA